MALNAYIRGTKFADLLNGSGLRDKIYGKGGADVINAGAGNDKVKGGNGDDLITAGAGNDIGEKLTQVRCGRSCRTP